MVLHGGDEDLVALGDVAATVALGDQIDAFRGAANEHNLARQLGGALGVAGVTAVVAAITPMATLQPHASGGLAGYYMAFFLLILLASLAIPAVSLFRVGTVARPKPAESGRGIES